MAKRNDNDNLISNPDILHRFSVDMLVITVALFIAGVYLNGLGAVRTALFSVATAVIAEDIACRVTKRKDRRTHDMYAAATGLAIALMLPATVPSYVAFIASAFAVAAVLIPFGSARKVPFVPAAAGFCFAAVCFPEAVFTYAAVSPGFSSPVFGTEGFLAAESFSQMLKIGKSVFLNPLENISILMGKTPGPMGTTCMLVLLGCAVYMFLKRKESFLISFSFIASCALIAALFPRVNSGVVTSAVMELSSGTLFFTGLVLLTDPFTSPQKPVGKIMYGIFAAVICMLLRRYGAFEESACFTVLIMNAVSPAVGDYTEVVRKSLVEKGVIKEKEVRFSESEPKKEKKKKEKTKKEKVTSDSKKSKKKQKPTLDELAVHQEKEHSATLSYDELLKFDDSENEAAESKEENNED